MALRFGALAEMAGRCYNDLKIFLRPCNKRASGSIVSIEAGKMLSLFLIQPAPLSGSGAEELDRCLARMASGDTDALGRLYELTHEAVFGYALSLTKNAHDAEDIAQETFVRAHLSAGGYVSQGKPTAWLMRIARNLALMRLREGKRTVAMSPEDWMETFADRPDFSRDDAALLAELMETLRDEEREIVSLHALTGLKHREIAAMMDLAVPTVLSKYNRAIKKLRAALEGGQNG